MDKGMLGQPPKSVDDIKKIISKISFTPFGTTKYTFRVTVKVGEVFVQVVYDEPDVDDLNGEIKTQYGRKWFISKFSTETEIVETCWAAVQRSMLHVAKENFYYRGARIYSPHIPVGQREMMIHHMDDWGGFDKRAEPNQCHECKEFGGRHEFGCTNMPSMPQPLIGTLNE